MVKLLAEVMVPPEEVAVTEVVVGNNKTVVVQAMVEAAEERAERGRTK